ncbi:sigma-70 family RNA polymerase sigma factor [Verticiella sediminum]|uniref:Sigma-70 family RNA polymerase sigma factor n=1 Tax=Verticiella sediminum TaxID=1247510 RepID=A0A556AL57_9BURK|nr:sigma-70 family RNA polymerase sigma factor [Verticiella sediminum]TSH93609.1 sigma-70 family RNA polymerase sigma factor [Verticiella sediminum]
MSNMGPAPQDARTLYHDHHGWLYALLRRKLRCTADAADLAHDVFVRLLIKPRSFDSHEGTRAYLSTMARGLCTDLWRRRQIEQAWLDALAAQPAAHVPSAEVCATVLETLYQLDALLRRLPHRAADAFLLAMVHELPDREIAARLGVSERTVRNHVARALLACTAWQARAE